MSPKNHSCAQETGQVEQTPEGESERLRQVAERDQENRLVRKVEEITHAIVCRMEDVLQMLVVQSAQIEACKLAGCVEHRKPTRFAESEVPKHEPEENCVDAQQHREQWGRNMVLVRTVGSRRC